MNGPKFNFETLKVQNSGRKNETRTGLDNIFKSMCNLQPIKFYNFGFLVLYSVG